MPEQWFGKANFPAEWNAMDWARDLPNNTYYALWLRWPSLQNPPPQLPLGHPLYLVAFLDEPFDHEWLLQQALRVESPIIVLNDGYIYDLPVPDNVFYFTFHSWQHQCQRIQAWFPQAVPRLPRFKVSAVCNRLTQSKIMVFAAIMQNFDQQDCLIKLSNWLDEKDAHYRSHTGVQDLDELQDYFFNNWFGQEIVVDDWNNLHDNFQRYNSDPWHPVYTASAIHFTNESYHYSLMQDDLGSYIRPGPCLSEKTFKCLVSGTPFISVGQYDVYRSLADLGFTFDYQEIDLSWDQLPGNLDRLCGIVQTVRQLSNMTVSDIEHCCRLSGEQNFHHVWSGSFEKICSERNRQTIQSIVKQFG